MAKHCKVEQIAKKFHLAWIDDASHYFGFADKFVLSNDVGFRVDVYNTVATIGAINGQCDKIFRFYGFAWWLCIVVF